MLTLRKLRGGSRLAWCDLCLRRPAVYIVKQDGTRLCDGCRDRYLEEHNIESYRVVKQ